MCVGLVVPEQGKSRPKGEVAIRGDVLRSFRDREGWTQGELAYHARVDQSQISKIEAGTLTDVRLSTARRLALALGVTLDELAGMPRRGEEAGPQGRLPIQHINLRKVPPEQREQLRRAIEAMVRQFEVEDAEEKGRGAAEQGGGDRQ